MLIKQFSAKTKSGIEITVNAENTEKKLITNYKVKCVPTKQGALYVISLSKKQTKELLGKTLTNKQPEALVAFEDQAGWKAFEVACGKERYEAEQAKPKNLEEKREMLASAEYNAYREDAFPGSKAWNIWTEAHKSLNEFDAAHPEIVAEITRKANAKRKEELKHINIWNL